jgi:hypothetical protein
MPFFKKIFQGRPLKRLEVKIGTPKFRIRASRTGGINTAIHPLKGLTLNTKHGLRVSKTFRGLTLGFQDGNSILRGRWSSKGQLLNLNLSKSGFSWSSKSRFGTYNISNPSRSSFKYAGIQIRGKKASGLALIGSIFTLIPILISLIIKFIYALIYLVKIIIIVLFQLLQIIVSLISIAYNLLLFLIIDVPKQLLNISGSGTNSDQENQTKLELKEELTNRNNIDLEGNLNQYKTKYNQKGLAEKFIKLSMFLLGWSFYLSGFITIVLIPLTFFGLINFETSTQINLSFYIIMTITSLFCLLTGFVLTIPYKSLLRQKGLEALANNSSK